MHFHIVLGHYEWSKMSRIWDIYVVILTFLKICPFIDIVESSMGKSIIVVCLVASNLASVISVKPLLP